VDGFASCLIDLDGSKAELAIFRGWESWCLDIEAITTRDYTVAFERANEEMMQQSFLVSWMITLMSILSSHFLNPRKSMRHCHLPSALES
jgi:hypothetical protein